MADTIREQIISAYLARLADWTTGNGFNYSCGESVERAKAEVNEADLPVVVLWPQPETAEFAYGINRCSMVLKLEVLALVENENRSVVQERLLGDAIKIMTDPAVTVASLVAEIAYQGGGPAGTEKAEETVTAISAEFKVEYETVVGDPYSTP